MKRIPQFECKMCGECCKDLSPQSIILFPNDIIIMATQMRLKPKEFVDKYCIMESLCIENESVELCYLNTNYDNCPFLEENRCRVHEYKPTQCRLTPYGFFSYYSIWSYLQCISTEDYPEGCSNESDIQLVNELLLKGYKFE